MGGSQSMDFTHDEQSLIEPGQKSVISGPLDGVEADKLFAGFEKYVRLGKGATGKEAKFEVEDTGDNGAMTLSRFTIPELLGGGDFASRTVFKFDQAKRTLQAALTWGDVYWERKLIHSTSSLVVHSDPVRLEFWTTQHPIRTSGKVLCQNLKYLLKSMGLDVEVKAEQPGISEPSKFSVVTDPISSTDITPENFMEKLKDALVNECGGVELPDGTVAEDRSGMFELFKSFAKHEFETDKSFIYEYGDDETFTVLRSISHVQVHKSPFRVELWNEAMGARFASEPEKKFVKEWASRVLKFMEEEGG